VIIKKHKMCSVSKSTNTEHRKRLRCRRRCIYTYT